MNNCKPKYAAKGLPKVPGKPKGTDIIPAWLTPGEAVLSPGAAEMLGRGNVQALNRAANHMRLGSPQYKVEGDANMQMDGQMQEAQRIVSNPTQYTPEQVQAAQAYLDQQPQQEAQYFMGGTGMVLGQPRYMADGGMLDFEQLDKQNRQWVNTNRPQFDPGTGGSLAADIRKAVGPVEPPMTRNTSSPGGMFQMQQPPINPRASNQDFVNRSLPQYMRETVKPALQSIDRAISPFIPGIGAPVTANADRPGQTYQGPTLGSKLQEGINGLQGVAQQGVNSLRGQAQSFMAPRVAADDKPGTGNAMTNTQLSDYLAARPAQAGSNPIAPATQSRPTIQPVRLGDRIFTDQASADAARPQIEQENKLLNNQGSVYANRQSVPGYQPTLGQPAAPTSMRGTQALPNPVTRPQQPLQTMAQPIQARQSGVLDTDPGVAAMRQYMGSKQRLVDMEDRNNYNYWSTVDSLKNLITSDDPELARSAAGALGGLSAPNLNGMGGAASMYGSDVARNNSGLDYNAKMSELGAGQRLRDAQAQESMGRANYYQSDADMQNAMLQNPERFAALKQLGGRGRSSGPDIKEFDDGTGVKRPYIVGDNGLMPAPVVPTFEQFKEQYPNITDPLEQKKRYENLRARFAEPGLLQGLKTQ